MKRAIGGTVILLVAVGTWYWRLVGAMPKVVDEWIMAELDEVLTAMYGSD